MLCVRACVRESERRRKWRMSCRQRRQLSLVHETATQEEEEEDEEGRRGCGGGGAVAIGVQDAFERGKNVPVTQLPRGSLEKFETEELWRHLGQRVRANEQELLEAMDAEDRRHTQKDEDFLDAGQGYVAVVRDNEYAVVKSVFEQSTINETRLHATLGVNKLEIDLDDRNIDFKNTNGSIEEALSDLSDAEKELIRPREEWEPRAEPQLRADADTAAAAAAADDDEFVEDTNARAAGNAETNHAHGDEGNIGANTRASIGGEDHNKGTCTEVCTENTCTRTGDDGASLEPAANQNTLQRIESQWDKNKSATDTRTHHQIDDDSPEAAADNVRIPETAPEHIEAMATDTDNVPCTEDHDAGKAPPIVMTLSLQAADKIVSDACAPYFTPPEQAAQNDAHQLEAVTTMKEIRPPMRGHVADDRERSPRKAAAANAATAAAGDGVRKASLDSKTVRFHSSSFGKSTGDGDGSAGGGDGAGTARGGAGGLSTSPEDSGRAKAAGGGGGQRRSSREPKKTDKLVALEQARRRTNGRSEPSTSASVGKSKSPRQQLPEEGSLPSTRRGRHAGVSRDAANSADEHNVISLCTRYGTRKRRQVAGSPDVARHPLHEQQEQRQSEQGKHQQKRRRVKIFTGKRILFSGFGSEQSKAQLEKLKARVEENGGTVEDSKDVSTYSGEYILVCQSVNKTWKSLYALAHSHAIVRSGWVDEVIHTCDIKSATRHHRLIASAEDVSTRFKDIQFVLNGSEEWKKNAQLIIESTGGTRALRLPRSRDDVPNVVSLFEKMEGNTAVKSSEDRNIPSRDGQWLFDVLSGKESLEKSLPFRRTTSHRPHRSPLRPQGGRRKHHVVDDESPPVVHTHTNEDEGYQKMDEGEEGNDIAATHGVDNIGDAEKEREIDEEEDEEIIPCSREKNVEEPHVPSTELEKSPYSLQATDTALATNRGNEGERGNGGVATPREEIEPKAAPPRTPADQKQQPGRAHEKSMLRGVSSSSIKLCGLSRVCREYTTIQSGGVSVGVGECAEIALHSLPDTTIMGDDGRSLAAMTTKIARFVKFMSEHAEDDERITHIARVRFFHRASDTSFPGGDNVLYASIEDTDVDLNSIKGLRKVSVYTTQQLNHRDRSRDTAPSASQIYICDAVYQPCALSTLV